MKNKVIGVLLTYNCENLFKSNQQHTQRRIDDLICSDDGSKDKLFKLLRK